MEREQIVRDDFPTARKGWSPEAVRAHLIAVAAAYPGAAGGLGAGCGRRLRAGPERDRRRRNRRRGDRRRGAVGGRPDPRRGAGGGRADPGRCPGRIRADRDRRQPRGHRQGRAGPRRRRGPDRAGRQAARAGRGPRSRSRLERPRLRGQRRDRRSRRHDRPGRKGPAGRGSTGPAARRSRWSCPRPHPSRSASRGRPSRRATRI